MTIHNGHAIYEAGGETCAVKLPAEWHEAVLAVGLYGFGKHSQATLLENEA